MAQKVSLDFLKETITSKRRRLELLKQKEAMYGFLETPTHILIDIENLEKEIEADEAALRQLQASATDAPVPAGAVKWLPIVFAVTGLVLLTALGIGLAQNSDNPPATAAITPLPNIGLNIVVAEFTPVTGAPLLNPDDGRNLRDTLVAAMEAALADLPEWAQPGKVRPIEAIPDFEPAAREAGAAQLARAHHAVIVLYGRIAPQANGVYLVYPEFYIAPNAQGFDYGAEIVGATQFGEPVQFLPPFNASERAGVNARLQARIEALQQVVRGLSDFGLQHDDAAYLAFNTALNRLRESSPDESGQEVIHLLLGAVKLREFRRFSGLSLDPNMPVDANLAEAARKQAALHFSDGLALNPGYARLNLGLGGIALAQAIQLIPADQPWPETIVSRLEDARYFYANALPAPDEQSPYGYVSAKAQFGVAQAQLGLYEYYQQQARQAEDPTASRQLARNAYTKAETGLQQVVSAYQEAGQPAQLLEIAGQAQALLGKLALLEARYLTAAGQTESAQSLFKQTLLACDAAYPLLESNEQDGSRLAVYYHAKCLDWQAEAYLRGQPPNPTASAGACATAVPLGLNSGVLRANELTCSYLQLIGDEAK